MLKKYPNYQDAAEYISNINLKIFEWMTAMRKIYADSPNKDSHEMLMIEHMITNYNPEAIYENDPLNSRGETSFTIDKGRTMYVCIRNKDDPLTFTEENTMMFVIIHELSHIANYKSWGHDDIFWDTFKFMLEYAVNYGIYKAVDYQKNPTMYCGMEIDYSPLFDH